MKMEKLESIYLQDPDDRSLINAFRSLPRFGEISLSVEKFSLDVIIKKIENAGFCGIVIEHFNNDDIRCKIWAYKGKQGPCYDTHRLAIYTGVAVAVMDDDNHLLIAGEEMPVCEKTVLVYSLPPYQALIRCTEVVSEKMDRPKSTPEVFDCDDFEENQEKLYNSIGGEIGDTERTALFYPGPFKLLIMKDGTVIRRGRINSVPISDEGRLIKSEKMFRVTKQMIINPEYFQHNYKSLGPQCLLEPNKDPADFTNSDIPSDFTLLSGLSTALRERLLNTINHDKKYFILTGSDPGDKLGCCPSHEVEEANQLVRAGILSSYKHPAPEGSCPVTTYAFRDEMDKREGKIEFKIDQSFRDKVSQFLKKKRVTSLLRVIKWILTGFVAVSLVMAIMRMHKNETIQGNLTLYEQLSPENKDQVMIILFHFEKRCELCLNMEKMIRDLIAQEYVKDNYSNPVLFKLISIEDRNYRNLVERFGIYTSTPVIFSFEKKEEKRVYVLKDAFQYYRDEAAFKEMIEVELDNHIQKPND